MDVMNLHDATLVSIAIKWDRRVDAEVEFRDEGPKLVKLECRGLRNLICPHEAPWGPSVSVNRIQGSTMESESLSRLEIEIQSGDVLVIEAETFTWIS